MNMQYNEWVNSDHAQSLVNMLDDENADASCLTCHSADSTYIARLTRDTGASLYAIGRTRGEARRRVVAALEARFAAHYASEQAITATTSHPED